MGIGMHAGVVAENGKFAAEVMRETGGRGVDVVLDLVGGGYVAESLGCMSPRGRLVLVGLMAGRKSELDLGLILSKRLTIVGTVLRSRPLEEKIEATSAFARHLVPLLGSAGGKAGQLRPIVDRVMPIAEAAAAHKYVESNDGFGKVVLQVP
jgi:NADPH:quinone reductase-like Zn-dependent oxidoreductase